MSSETPPSSVTLHPPSSSRKFLSSNINPFPQLLQTPSGLALLELQGTINLPDQVEGGGEEIKIGRLEFPDYDEGEQDQGEGKWMKRVWMWVGRYQRLQGEVKKLPQAIAVVRRRGGGGDAQEEEDDAIVEDLEIVEIVKYKIVFSQRPEPVTGEEQTTGMDLD
ncbi:Ctf8-domain-containing protein [Podospora fimiseda]|uniref:Ctf8-domain-containing protein n=1 Tax=Podospora fimiseda TaxID=252190 RepID=A0AAN7BR13_9PEZI|nr:Ctf8-domain-containing protein [Podospora fimiseda]